MQFIETELKGVILVEVDVHKDPRGFFLEICHAKKYAAGGIPGPFVQHNFSKSFQGTIRGLHYQLDHAQGKLVTVVEGKVFDVAVDIRRGSPSFGKWVGFELSVENGRQLYIPTGFAHGFCVLSETAGLIYNCTDFYSPRDERGIIWNDPAIGIRWPLSAPLLSAKDQAYKTLAEMTGDLPLYEG
ncbi:MAG: dTDP-4-dehydrorhamnose 3,5-epimerase [Nitrospirota bacterium]